MSVLTSYTLGSLPWQTNLRVVVVPIKRRRKNSLKIPTEISTPTPGDFKRKSQTVLTDIGGEWYLNTTQNTKPPMDNPRLSNK